MKRHNLFTGFLISSLLLFLSISTVQAAGEIDPAFNVSAYSARNNGYGAQWVETQPDGKLLIAGAFSVINGISWEPLARVNADGSLDTSFNPPDFFYASQFYPSGAINALALQPDGKILVGGGFSVGTNYKNLVRLNPNGSLDTTFNSLDAQVPQISVVYRIEVLPDGSFFLGLYDSSNNKIYKFDANGSIVPSWQFQGTAGATTFAPLPDGRVYAYGIGNNQALKRLNADATPDPTYPILSVDNPIYDIVVQPDGKVLIAGAFRRILGINFGQIARLNQDGSFDSSFNPGGVGTDSVIYDLELAPDGKIYIGGAFTTYNGTTRNRIARLNADGTLDNSFVYTPPFNNATINKLKLLPNGKLAVVGPFLGPNTAPATVVVLNPDGSQDSGFVVRTGLPGRVRKMAQQPDGKILIAGEFMTVNGVLRNSIARLNLDGSIDGSFVPFLNSNTLQYVIHQVVVQPDGKILISITNGFVVARLNPDGSQDMTFSTTLYPASAVYDFALQPDGKVLIVGNISFTNVSGERVLSRLNGDGTLDMGFNPFQPNATIYRVLLQPDGKCIVAGDFTQILTAVRGRIARYNANGTLDDSFNPTGGGASAGVYDIDLQADGKIVLGGNFATLNGSASQARIGRLNPDGSLDTSFAQTANSTVQTVKVQPDGKILIGGLFTDIGGTPRERLARLNPNGSPDFSFNASADALVFDIFLQTDGKILVGGDFIKINNTSKMAIVRLLNAAVPIRPLFDYDGDGKADISVYRPSTNRWYVFKSSDSTVTETTFGIAGDVPVPADFDGDGKTDIAIFRPSSGDWWSLSSINGAQIFAHWGANGDIPRPSDFDGDGRTDYVVFRPSDNFWYRISSGNGASSNGAFGLAGDKPVTGDFDGDGKSDKAIFRPSSGDWWYQSSLNGAQLAVHWGISTDIPAPGDFDGDGKTDFAVYRPSTGVWYVINSSNFSFTIMNFGIAEDKPVPADYDGDGKADIAVFRPSTGTWYQMKTTAGFAAQQFGVSTDIPTENAFVP